tara:strand:+ start:1367 stop:1585 length:219 start_codon:yes stop_codon:yes gene_type:complete
MKLNKEQVLGIIRHVLTAIGVILVATGKLDEITYMNTIGVIIAATSAIWSIFDKTDGQITKRLADFSARTKK